MSRVIKLQENHFPDTVKQIRPRLIENPPIHSLQPAAVLTEDLMLQAEKKANQMLAEANELAAKMRKNIEEERRKWETEKQHLRDAAWNEGYQQGLQEGRKEGAKEYRQLIHQGRQIIDQSRAEYKTYIEKAEPAILGLAVESARVILDSTLSEAPEKFAGVVKRALKETTGKEVHVHVHPSRYELVLAEKSHLESMYPYEKMLFIYPSEEISENGCIIETEYARIDAGIDSQLAELKEKLLEILSAGQP